MAHFNRTKPAPKVNGDYRAFRPYVRFDFKASCAYCLIDELFAAGEENFELDHFRPKSLFPQYINNFENLYYSCHVCNNIKRDKWPPEELGKIGIEIIDLCKEDFEQHYRILNDGSWEPLTKSAEYTLEVLRLNRPHLKRLRSMIRQAAFGTR